jgi:hypothetical protein
MPRHCEWIERLDEIQAALRQSPEALLDRASVEQLFRVSRRHACRLLQQFGAVPLGGAMVIPGRELLQRLEQWGRQDAVVQERERRERLADTLNQARQDLRARRVVISPQASAEPPPSLRELPEAIQLAPGQLRVSFSTPTELLQHLLLLAQAISEDWVDFEAQAGVG